MTDNQKRLQNITTKIDKLIIKMQDLLFERQELEKELMEEISNEKAFK